MTTSLRLLELDIPLPDNVTIVLAPAEASREVRVLEGVSSATAAGTIESSLIKAGFMSTRTTPRDTVLRREDQVVNLFQRTSTTVVVRIEDPTASPPSQVKDGGVQIREIEVAIVAARIMPGRERHATGSREWSADWTVFGPSAADLCAQLRAAFLAMGLRDNGVWAPPEGTARWKVEAYSADRLLQAEVVARLDHCELRIHLVTS